MGKDRLRKKIGRRTSTRQMYAGQRAHQPIELTRVRLDGGTQPREAFDEAVVEEYAERMAMDDRGFVVDPQGQSWEPIVLYDDDDTLWLADGFHRVRAARAAGLETFQAKILPGDRRDAVKFSLSANARHGLRRTSADKRRAVRRALQDDEWGALSARALAELCAVSDYLVRQIRQALEERGELEEQTQRIGADGKVHDVSTRVTTTPSSSAKKRSTKSSKRAQRLTLSEPVGITEELEATQLTIEGLDGASDIDAAECVIAYPHALMHFDALSDHLPRMLAGGGALIVPLDQGRDSIAGCARLDALVARGALEAPRWVVLHKEKRVAIVWTTPGAAPIEQEWLADLDALLDHLAPASTTVVTRGS